MRRMKYIIGFIFLFMIIGYATISVSLSIGGDANILSNADDFRVYFSNALLNDEENIFLIKSDTELSFNVDLVELGSIQKISYDVTNASSVFDASLSINCTQGDELISITNEFDTSTNLLAKETRSGVLTLKKIRTNTNPTDQKYSITCTITASPIERTSTNTETPATPVIKEYRTLKATSSSDTTMFRSSTYKEKIKTITFEDEINIRSNKIEEWDISEEQDNSIIAYVTPNETDSTYYNLYIQSDKLMAANKNMSYWFANMRAVEEIKGLELLNTIQTTNMQYLFYYTGFNSLKFTLDISSFDTRNVTNMGNMFDSVGFSSTDLNLVLGNLNTSKVTNMNSMFLAVGYSDASFSLDISSFDTRNVTNMGYMFRAAGYKSPEFSMDISNFNTSKVTNMSNMFYNTGYNSKNLILDVSNFDTSKVTNMSYMFYQTAYNNPTFELDVSDFDTSQVTNMNAMFYKTGHASTIFTLDVSNFNTSKVTNMSNMFNNTAFLSTVIELNVSGFDTSQVTNMNSMFRGIGYNSPNFNLDISNFDMSKVTDTAYMFKSTGESNGGINTSITITNPNVTDFSYMFDASAKKTGSQITVNYTSATSSLVDQMIATKSSTSNVVKGVLKVDIDNISIGDEITINNEHFNVISQTKDTITMLAQYNLGTDYRQSTTANTLRFSESKGWEYYPGPKEIEISQYGGNADTYLKNYAAYLNNIVKESNISSNLITMTTLKNLGCTITDNYSISSETLSCTNSQHVLWLVNGQSWWTRSAYSGNADDIWIVSTDGSLYGFQQGNFYGGRYGIRPIITISKNVLKLE